MGIKRGGLSFAAYLSFCGLSTCRMHDKQVCDKCTDADQSVRFQPDADDIGAVNMTLVNGAHTVVVDMSMIEHQLVYEKSWIMGRNSRTMSAADAADKFVERLKPYMACFRLVLIWDSRDSATIGPHRLELGASSKRKTVREKMPDADAARPLNDSTVIHPFTQINSNGRRTWQDYAEKYIYNAMDKRNANQDQPKELLIIGAFHQIRGTPELVAQLQINTAISCETDTRMIHVLRQFPVTDGCTVIVNNDADAFVLADLELPHQRLYWVIGSLNVAVIDLTRWHMRNTARSSRVSMLLAQAHQDLLIWETDYGDGTPNYRTCYSETAMLPAVSLDGDVATVDLLRLQRLGIPLRDMPGMREQMLRALFMLLYYCGWEPSPYMFGWTSQRTFVVPNDLVPEAVFSDVPAKGRLYFRRINRQYARQYRRGQYTDKEMDNVQVDVSVDVHKALEAKGCAPDGVIDVVWSAISEEQDTIGEEKTITVRGINIAVRRAASSADIVQLVCDLA
jgi:hypothetical protein